MRLNLIKCEEQSANLEDNVGDDDHPCVKYFRIFQTCHLHQFYLMISTFQEYKNKNNSLEISSFDVQTWNLKKNILKSIASFIYRGYQISSLFFWNIRPD